MTSKVFSYNTDSAVADSEFLQERMVFLQAVANAAGVSLDQVTEEEMAHVPFLELDPRVLIPSPENKQVYGQQDAHIRRLAKSIRQHRVLKNLVVERDGFILDGHCRREAAILDELETVPVVIRWDVSRLEDPDRFLAILTEYNRARVKSTDEILREELVATNPDEAYRRLKQYRADAAQVEVETLDISAGKPRAKISPPKMPFLTAACSVVLSMKNFWPLSLRQVHYLLQNDPPLIHAKKPGSRYKNNLPSYRNLSRLLVIARLRGDIPMKSIDDETRPFISWKVHDSPQDFIRKHLDSFLQGYARNLLKSQPFHLEAIVEKNTVLPIVKPVASDFTLPITSGRGFCSLPPRAHMIDRFFRSGKDRLVVIVLADLDPEGWTIPQSFGDYILKDFGDIPIEVVRAGLTPEQAVELNLPGDLEAKAKSPNFKRFVREHGTTTVYELEAVPAPELQRIFRDAIESVIDGTLFNAEVEQEKRDWADLDRQRRAVRRTMIDMNVFDELEEDEDPEDDFEDDDELEDDE